MVPLAAVLISFSAFASALFGGMLAMRAVGHVGLVIAFGAGIRIGAAFFDLIPESVEHVGSLNQAMIFTALGFLAFYAIEKLTALHVGHETATELDHDDSGHRHPRDGHRHRWIGFRRVGQRRLRHPRQRHGRGFRLGRDRRRLGHRHRHRDRHVLRLGRVGFGRHRRRRRHPVHR